MSQPEVIRLEVTTIKCRENRVKTV